MLILLKINIIPVRPVSPSELNIPADTLSSEVNTVKPNSHSFCGTAIPSLTNRLHSWAKKKEKQKHPLKFKACDASSSATPWVKNRSCLLIIISEAILFSERENYGSEPAVVKTLMGKLFGWEENTFRYRYRIITLRKQPRKKSEQTTWFSEWANVSNLQIANANKKKSSSV